MRRTTVAVVLSNFNHGRYLRESLEAIRNQTRPADEIVVVDDGSTDNSATIIDEFMQCGPNVRLIRNPRNIGLQASMARALPTVTAEYLVWAAADDRLLPTFLEKSMALLERYPSSGLCFSELSVLKGDTTEIERFATIPWLSRLYDLSNLPAYLDPSAIRDRMRRAYLPMTSNSVIVRRQALLELGGYPGQLEWYADSFAYTVVALRHGACVVAETLALLRASAGSYSASGRRSAARERAVLRSILDLLARESYRDIRRAFRECPSNFSPYGMRILGLQLARARDWDLALPYLWWILSDDPRHRVGTWPTALTQLAARGLASIPPLRAGVRLLRAARGRPAR